MTVTQKCRFCDLGAYNNQLRFSLTRDYSRRELKALIRAKKKGLLNQFLRQKPKKNRDKIAGGEEK